jgi:DNA (cytosine-5)-methyltransferase 1
MTQNKLDQAKEGKNRNPLRVIELFAGIGSQAKALKNLKIPIIHHRVVEFDKYAIKSYNAIHNTNFETSDITQICSKDLGIIDTDKNDYLLTYSFPCQDLSKAGKGKGMTKGDNTRSGLLWEVERLLRECKELPQYLLMENVPDVIGQKNIKDFAMWCEFLESIGYRNFYQLLNAKDYGIPQNRNRCFMVSILKTKNQIFQFPKPIPLKLRLKDLLEDEVDEKYYLSETAIQYMFNTNYQQSKFETRVQGEIASTLCARDYKDPKCILVGNLEHKVNVTDKTLCLNSKVNGKQPSVQNRIYDTNAISTAITTSFMPSIAIPEATKKGYALAKEGDGIYINRPHQKRGCVQKNMIQTLKTSGNDVGVVVRGNYSPSGHNASRIVDKNGLSPTVMENHGTVTAVVVGEKEYSQKSLEKIKNNIKDVNGLSNTITANPQRATIDSATLVVAGEHRRDEGIRTFKDDAIGTLRAKEAGGDKVVVTNQPLRIRKLTPKECWRLMGFSDEDFDKASKVNSNSQLYKQAGNSIVVNVLMEIFKKMFIDTSIDNYQTNIFDFIGEKV